MHHTTKVCLYLTITIATLSCVQSDHQDRTVDRGEGNCKHDTKKLLTNCTLSFHGYEINTYTRLYQCSEPTEMMVVTKVDGLNIDHERVFVNDDERVKLKGYNEAFIHVQMHSITTLESIEIKVSYTFDQLETVAYNQNITLHTELCPPKNNDGKIFTPFTITILSALAFVLLAGMVSFFVLYNLHQRRVGHQTKLMSQMESTAMTSPYQVGPSESSLRIEYKIAVESQKTSDSDEVLMNPALVQMTNQKQLVDLEVSRSRPKTSKKSISTTSSREIIRSKLRSSKFNKDIVHPENMDVSCARPKSSKFDHVQPAVNRDTNHANPTANKVYFDSTVSMLPKDSRGSRHSLTQV
ncbi:uncharacterized protein [Antedon mediterranea]|uniref:uncharacterized protein n=1 Tax=Antedon mediterranea TaxID=105859 RepID=UPI003AF51B04